MSKKKREKEVWKHVAPIPADAPLVMLGPQTASCFVLRDLTPEEIARTEEKGFAQRPLGTAPRQKGGASPYRKGRKFEYQVIEHLEALGYFVVRSAKSGGPADLVAIRRVFMGEVLLIQCKRCDFPPPKEWNVLLEIARERLALPIVARLEIDRIGKAELVFRRLIAPRIVGTLATSKTEIFEP